MIRSIIANEMKERAGDPPTFQVARVFCDHQIPGIHDLRDPMDIIMSLWAQLVASLPDPKFDPEYIKAILSRRETFSSMTKKWERKMEIFAETTAKIGSVVLILDGLDEVQRDHQQEVVAGLREIQQRSKRCRILITSRPYYSIMGLFHCDSPQSKFHLEAKKIDLRLYITDRFSRNYMSRGGKFHKQEEITLTLVDKCKGSFLLAKLFMDEVLRANTDKECSEIIKGLPESAAEAYDRGMNRLAQESVSSKLQTGLPCTAIQALFWVAYAKAPMTERQLRQALAINEGDDDYNPSGEVWKDRGIDELCGELVLVDHRNGEVRVAHRTITEHLLLENTRMAWFTNIREHIPSVLLHFLLFKNLKTTHGGGSMGNIIQDFPLCSYALEYWGVGLNQTLKPETPIWALAERFLKTRFHNWDEHVKELMVNCLTSTCRCEVWKMAQNAVAPGQITGLHWAVFFDLRAFVPILSHHEEEFPVSDPIPTTPLGLAAAYVPESRQDMAQILLENGAKVNLPHSVPQVPRQPLHDAVYYCNVEVAELLLDSGADRSLRLVENDESAFDLAYILCRTGVAKLLASRISGNVVTAQELQFLVSGGFSADLQRVIKEGLDVNQPCGNGKRALDYALEAENERLSEVKGILVRARADTKLTWPPVMTDTCPYPVNFLEDPTILPLDVMEKSWSENDCAQWRDDDDTVPFLLLLEKAVPSHVKSPVRSIVFETASRDQGWSSWEADFNGTYLGSTTIQVSVEQPNGLKSPSLIIQRNLRANSRKQFKLHTNIWNLSELKTSSPRKAELIESLQPGSILRVSAHVRGGPGWANYVSFVRARLYEVEF